MDAQRIPFTEEDERRIASAATWGMIVAVTSITSSLVAIVVQAQLYLGATHLRFDQRQDIDIQTQVPLGFLVPGAPLTVPVPGGVNFLLGGEVETRSSALYADGRWALTPRAMARAHSQAKTSRVLRADRATAETAAGAARYQASTAAQAKNGPA